MKQKIAVVEDNPDVEALLVKRRLLRILSESELRDLVLGDAQRLMVSDAILDIRIKATLHSSRTIEQSDDDNRRPDSP